MATPEEIRVAAESMKAALDSLDSITPASEKLKAATKSSINASLELAREAKRTRNSGSFAAVQPPQEPPKPDADITAAFAALDPR